MCFIANAHICFSNYEQKARFQGGDANMFRDWVYERIIYPEEAIKNKTQGRVWLQFTIDTVGNLTDVKVIRGLSPELDAEAVRVVSSSPKWEPAINRKGRVIKTIYYFTCIFILPENKAIISAAEKQIDLFPKSTLIDIYKFFIQDHIGPWHMISDTASAGQYLREELRIKDISAGPEYYLTGYKGRYYRANLSVIKDGKVPYQVFFDAVLKSAKDAEIQNMDSWPKEWKTIEAALNNPLNYNRLSIPNDYNDIKAINDAILAGDYLFHHSEIYRNTYHPHYRLIEKTIFETEILPLLK